MLRAVESCQNITEGQTSCDNCKTTLCKVFFKLPIFSSFTADRRRRRHRIACSGRRVAPPWPRRTVGWPVCLDWGWQEQIQYRCGVGLSSAREDDHGRRLQSLPSARPDARPTWRIVASYIQQSPTKICTNLLCSETTVYWPHFFAVTIKAHVHSVMHGQLWNIRSTQSTQACCPVSAL